MQWIEIMGPHGIGKTTLLRGFLKFTKQPKHPLRAVGFRAPAERLNHNSPTAWGVTHWAEFLRTVERLYRNSKDDSNPCPKRRRNFCRVVLRMAAIEKADSNWLGCMDSLGSEGMRLSFVLRDLGRISSYYETMPVSSGVIMLEADRDVIVARNRERKATDFGTLTVKGILACTIAMEVLAKRTRLLRLDAIQPIEDNVRAIAKFAGFEESK